MKKKIVIYYPSFERGGVTVNLINLIKGFDDKKFEIILISNLGFNKAKGIFKNSCNYKKILDLDFLNFLPVRFKTSISGMICLKKILDENNQNIIVHSMQSNISSIIICKIKGVKNIIRNSEDPISSTVYSENKFISWFIFFLKIIFYNICDGIVTNSLGSKKSLEKFVYNKNKIKTIYNPYLKFKNKKNFKKKKILLNIGRLRKQKNHFLLIDAFYEVNKIYPDFKLIILGHGNLKDKLLNKINELKLNKKVFIKGWVDNTIQYIKKSKLFILSSLYEGLGNVLIDSINFKTPCISTNCKSGPSEILLNGKGGFLVKNNNTQELSRTIVQCIKNYDNAKRKNLVAHNSLYRFEMKRNILIYEKFLNKFFYN